VRELHPLLQAALLRALVVAGVETFHILLELQLPVVAMELLDQLLEPQGQLTLAVVAVEVVLTILEVLEAPELSLLGTTHRVK
jgi:hypothetical protein